MKQIFYSYNTIGDFLRDIENAETNDVFKNCELSSQKEGWEDFNGTASFEQAQNLLKYGDHDSAELIRASGNIKSPKRTNKDRAMPITSMVGYMPHIPNYLMGRPDCMIADTRIVHKQRVITIIIDGCVNCEWSAKQIADVQAKVVTAVRMVEAGGVRVNLWWYSASCCQDEWTGLLVKVKDSGKLLETEKLGYILVNPSMLRRHEFRFIETRKEIKRTRWTHGYGGVLNSADAQKMLEDNGVKFSYFAHISSLKTTPIEEIKKMFEQK